MILSMTKGKRVQISESDSTQLSDSIFFIQDMYIFL